MARKNVLPWLIGTGAALLAVRFFFRKGQTAKNLNVNVTKVDFNQKNKTFVVFVRIINPGNAAIKINSIVADVKWNGTTSGTLDYRQPVTIGANEEKTLQIPVKTNLELLNLLTDILTKKVKDIVNGTFELTGVVNAEGLIINFDYSKKINLTGGA